jgi:alpha-glucosidase
MQDVPIPLEEVQDPQGLNMPGLNLSRDPSRTPMQWDDSPHAGFTTGKPWLRLADDYWWVNVMALDQDPESILTLYRKLIALRQAEPALKTGTYLPVYADSKILSYLREGEGQRFLIVLNLKDRATHFRPQDFSFLGRVELSILPGREGRILRNAFSLAGSEGLIIRLQES